MSGRISTVVASLVIEGLREHAPDALTDAEALEAIANAGDEGVPLAPYRTVLAAALAFDGGRALLRAGELLRRLEDPLLFVLLNTESPLVLIDKLGRLARFFHSRHGLIVESSGDTHLTLRHVATEDESPQPAESLAACGQHVVLLDEIGCRGLRLCFPESEDPSALAYAEREFCAPPPGGGYACWSLEWDAHVPTRKPMPGLDEILLGTAEHAELSETQTLVERIERVVMRDLARTWKVSEVADVLETSARSLQRALAAEGERYSDVVDRLRNQHAAKLLGDTELSITEIGYVCGFADSAHFSRSFKKRFGRSPSAWRADP